MYRAARVPPQSLEAEQATLGAMLLSAEAIDKAALLLRPEDFYREAHQILFQASCDLRGRSEPVDLTTLAAELENRGQLEQAGGRPYLAALLDAVPTAAHVEHYARIVEQKAILRGGIEAATLLAEDCFGEVESAEEVLSRAEMALRQIADRSRRKTLWTAAELMEEAMERLEVARERAAEMQERGEAAFVNGITFGLKCVDASTNGAQPGHLVLIGGESQAGKSSLTMLSMIEAARREKKAGGPGQFLRFDVEMDREGVEDRMRQMVGKVDSRLIRTGLLDAAATRKVSDATNEIAGLPIVLDDTKPVSPARVLTRARTVPNLRAIYIDYLQLMTPDGRHESERLGIESNLKALKLIAVEMRVPVFVVVSLNREGQIRETGLAKYHADTILMLREDLELQKKWEQEAAADRWGPPRSEEDVAPVPRWVELDKQRGGPGDTHLAGFIKTFALYVDVDARRA